MGSTGFTDLDDWYTAPLGRRYLERCWTAVAPLLAPLAGREILDVGCGAGHYSQLLWEAGARATGIDADARLVERARRRVPSGQFAVADAARLPFAAASFDAVLCANVLEFVTDSAAVLAELRRVSRGRAVIVVLNRASFWQVQQHLGRLVSAHPYYRGHFFDIERINAEARQAGWQVASLEPTVFFPPLPVEALLEWSEGRVDNACWVAGLVAAV